MTDVIARLSAALSDRYTVERELGAGGMATVYLVHDIKHDRDVAMKVLHPDLGAALGAERFLTEIRTTARLQHPHILPLLDSGDANGLLYYVMPYVSGETLHSKLRREKQLPIDEALLIAREVADALGYAHSLGIIHRDIKPDNILLQHGHALVADFGIALAVQSAGGARMTQTGISVGTPQYMSPEQAMGERALDARSDIYALGAVTYEMLVGDPPYTGSTAQAIVAKVMTEKPVSIVAHRERVPQRVEDAVLKALEKLPADRFASAAQFATALDAVPAITNARGNSKSSKIPKAGWAIFAIVCAVMALASFFVGRAMSHQSTQPIGSFGAATKVTYEPGVETLPSISPDGKSVAYSAGPVGAWRIYIRQTAGGRIVPLTNDSGAVESNAAWSSDGKRILFLAQKGVFSAAGGGGDVRPEIPPPANSEIRSATWSPDGKSIAYNVGDSLWLWNDKHRAKLIAAVPDLGLCSWSPKGELIACVSGNFLYSKPDAQTFANDAPSRIVVMRVSDGRVKTVSDTLSLNQNPIWSPDGKWLYYISRRDGPRDVYATRVNGDGSASGTSMRLTTGLAPQAISLSGDGSRLAYSVYRTSSNIWSVAIPTSVNTVASLANATPHTIGDQTITSLTVSRDGRYLYYDSELSGKGQIYRVALPSGTPERVTDDGADDFAPSISPNGKELAFHSYRTGSRDLYVMPLDGGAVQHATSGPAQEMLPSWSPDGTMLAYSSLAFPSTVWTTKRNADGSWGVPVRRAEGYLVNWLPDSKSIIYCSNTFGGGQILLLQLDAGKPRVVYDPDSTKNRPPAFVAISSDDGRDIFFKSSDANGTGSIWSVPLSGGSPRLIVRFDDPTRPSYRTEWAMSHGRMYFSITDRQSDVWVMEVNKP
ncbi:MAG: protein kinase [Gemmatimonadaceae bacterium]